MPTLDQIRSVEYPPIEDLGPLDVEAEDGDGEPATETEGETPAGSEAGAVDKVDAADPAAAAGSSVDAGGSDPAAADAGGDVPSDPGVDKAKLFDQLNEKFTSDRAGFVKDLLSGLSDAERAAVLGQPSDQSDKSDSAAAPWEPESPAEEHYAKHYKTLEAVPAFAQQVHQEFVQRDRFLTEALITSHTTDAKVDAILQHLELVLPAADMAALHKVLADGKTGYRDAVKSHYRPALEKAIADKKQATRPRPRTPGNGSGDMPQIKKGASMIEIFGQL